MEATVICVDNSEFTRDGDFLPNRFQAQADAINQLAGAKTGANPENTVGVLTCASIAGKSPKVMVTPTTDLGKVLTALSSISIEGTVNVCKAAQIAQLALKHRQNKNQRQRIVLFIGSPVEEAQDILVKIAKKLKKNNVSVDVVSFGDCAEVNRESLEAFVAAVNKDSNSHFVEAPPGSNLCDFLLSTPVISQAGVDGVSGGDGGGAFDFGVDPNLDPEMAMVLRLSMEEEQARQAAAAQAAAAAAAAGEGAAAAAAGRGAEAPPGAVTAAAPAAGAGDTATAMEEEDEDSLLAQALAMSMQEETGTVAPAAGEQVSTTEQAISQSIEALPGVDVSNPELQAAIAAAARQLEEDDEGEHRDAGDGDEAMDGK